MGSKQMKHTLAEKIAVAELAHKYLQTKDRQAKYDINRGFDPNPYYTYKVEVALFDRDFHKAPTIHTVDVRLSDEEYLRLLQWQILNPESGINGYDTSIGDIIIEIELTVEDVLFPENEDGDDTAIGTYAIYLKEIRDDAAAIIKNGEI